MRLAFVISDLEAGGAERVTCVLASHWAAAGWDVTLISQFGERDKPVFFPLHPNVKVVRLDFERIGRESWPKTGKLRQLLALRRAILDAKPNVALSFMDTVNVRTLLATRGTGIPVVISERCDPSVRPIGFWWEHLRQQLYPLAARLVVQSTEALAFFSDHLQQRGCVIPNPVLRSTEVTARYEKHSAGVLISVGRLHPVKGFDRLIDAFQRVAGTHADWILEIWGEGSARNELAGQIQRAGLESRVFLKGRTDQPERELAAASAFVMTSHTEGFPMALGEAMACGLPVVAFDCPSGPRQLIRHDENGWLVPNGDVGALATALDRLMSEPDTRRRLGTRATEVITRFSLPAVSRLWEDVLSQAARPAAATTGVAVATPVGEAR